MKSVFWIFVLSLSLSSFTDAKAQNISLAMNYVEQGEYEKAKSIYEKLYERNPMKQDYLLGLGDVYIQLKEFDEAQQLFKNYIDKPGVFPNIMVELGYVYQIQKDSLNATNWYKNAIEAVKERKAFAYTTGRAFQDHNLLDYAIQTYEIANAEKPRTSYSIELAKLYGEKGDQKQMFENYIKIVEENQKYFDVIQRNLSNYIVNDAQDENNLILKRLLIKKLQEKPNILYNQILSWVFVQEESFNSSFAQEKAIFKRANLKDFGRLFDLSEVTTDANNFDIAEEIYDFIIEESQSVEIKLDAVENQMEINIKQDEKSKDITTKFLDHLEDYGYNAQTLSLQLLYAKYLAFNLNQWDKANLK